MAQGQDTGHHPGRKVGRENYVQGVFKGMQPHELDGLSGRTEGVHGIMFNQSTGEMFVHGPYDSKEEAQEANYGQHSAYDLGDVTHMDTWYNEGNKKDGK